MCAVSRNCLEDLKTQWVKLAGVCRRLSPRTQAEGLGLHQVETLHQAASGASAALHAWIYARCAQQSLKLSVFLSITRGSSLLARGTRGGWGKQL